MILRVLRLLTPDRGATIRFCSPSTDTGSSVATAAALPMLKHEPGSRAVPWEGSPAGLSPRLRVDTQDQCCTVH